VEDEACCRFFKGSAPSPKSVNFSLVLLFQNILVQSSNIRKSVILKNVAILHPCSDQSRKVLQTSRGVVRGHNVQGVEKSQVISTIHYICSERPQVRTWGRQTCFLPWAPSNLVTPLQTRRHAFKHRNATLNRVFFRSNQSMSCLLAD